MRIVSWNINGIRAIAGKALDSASGRAGFAQWLEATGAAIVGVQETRATIDVVPEALRSPPGWHASFIASARKGYSGVGMYSRLPFDEVSGSVGVRAIDVEGRVQIARFGALRVVNAYFPNGNGIDRDNSRVPYKLRFYKRLYRVLDAHKQRGVPIVVMGDFNTAPEEIDLARPKDNKRTSGFLPEERREMARWLRAGWIDTYRVFESRGDRYTWWSQRYGVRARNIGWRIDLILASPGARPYLRGAAIYPEVMGSDHCPISIDVDDAIARSSEPGVQYSEVTDPCKSTAIPTDWRPPSSRRSSASTAARSRSISSRRPS